MDFSKIRLNNERNQHVVKRLNRLNTWQFFKVIYRDNIWRMFGFSLLMLLCVAPIIAMQVVAGVKVTELQYTLPMNNFFGFSTGVWLGVNDYVAEQSSQINFRFGLLTIAASALMAFMFSGGFAVIRDAFWTGKLSTVGVFKSMGKGIKAGFLYALISVAIIAFGIWGVIIFFGWLATVVASWLAVVLTVLVCLVLTLVICYLMIVCSVAVTYKQTVAETLDDAWRLLWLNILPNLVHLMLAVLPIPLYFIFGTGMLQTFYMVFLFMFGGLFFPLVWQTHMMKTFALFHPVESKKKKDVAREEEARLAAERAAAEQAAADRLARKEARKSSKNKI